MPTLGYLSIQHHDIVTEPWQVWVWIAFVVFMIGFIIYAIIELRKF